MSLGLGVGLGVLGAGVIVVTTGLAWERRPLRTPGLDGSDPYQVAFVAGGAELVRYAALAALRHRGVIEAGDDGLIRVTAPLPAGSTQQEAAVHAAIGKTAATRCQIFARAQLPPPGIAPAHRQDTRVLAVIQAGLALTAWTLALTAWGMAWRTEPDHTFRVLLACGATAILLSVPVLWQRPTRVDESVLRLRQAHTGPLIPGEPALSVALYGTASLWAADPDFAWRADVPRRDGMPRSPSRAGALDGDWDVQSDGDSSGSE